MAVDAKKVKLVWREEALHDILDLHAWLWERSPRAASRVERRIHARVSQLIKSPEIGRSGLVEGTRELVVGGASYLVVYRFSMDEIEVLAIRHGRRAR
jgi:toxin ParE1/3/4